APGVAARRCRERAGRVAAGRAAGAGADQRGVGTRLSRATSRRPEGAGAGGPGGGHERTDRRVLPRCRLARAGACRRHRERCGPGARGGRGFPNLQRTAIAMTTETHAGQAATGAEGSRAAPASAALWLAVAALVVALAAAGAAAVAFYQAAVTARLETGEQRGLVERLASEQDAVVERQGQVAARVDHIGARLDGLERSLTSALDQESRRRESALADFRSEFDALAGSVEQVYEDLGRSVDTWVLEEVEQLLLLANQRLTLAADTALAIAALEIADAKLGDI